MAEVSTERVNKNKEKEINKEKDCTVEIGGDKKHILPSLHPIMQEMLQDQLTKDRLCMNEKLTAEELNTFILEFFVLRTNEKNEDLHTLKDAQRYFGNWLRTRVEKRIKDKKGAENVKTTGNLHPALQ